MNGTELETHRTLRTSGEMAVAVAARLPALLRDERVSTQKLDDLLVAVSTRCIEIEHLQADLQQAGVDEQRARIAKKAADLWHNLADLVSARRSALEG